MELYDLETPGAYVSREIRLDKLSDDIGMVQVEVLVNSMIDELKLGKRLDGEEDYKERREKYIKTVAIPMMEKAKKGDKDES